MPEHLRALVVILVLATTVFAFAKAPACAVATAPADFERRRNLWIGITLAAFLAHNFWIYIIAAATLLLIAAPREPNKPAMFFFLLCVLPAVSAQISGMGLIDNLFTIHYVRLLALAVLLPAFLSLRARPDTERFGRTLPDKLIAGYLVLNFLLMLGASSMTFTNVLRHGAFYAFIEVFLPYYVASRALKDLQGFRDALMAFALAAMVHSAIATFEYVWHWLLYAHLDNALGVPQMLGRYLHRGEGGGLRAQGTSGNPVALGYVCAVAVGFYLYLRRSVPNAMHWGLGLLVLVAGLAAALSRGPWFGAVAMLLIFVATGPLPLLGLAKVGVLGAIALPALLVSPVGERFVDLLPFIGEAQPENLAYRQRLLEISFQVILRNPWFGSPDVASEPELQELRHGPGLIDIVNTYVGVALGSGLIGLSLFCGFFVAVGAGIFKGMRSLSDKSDEQHALGQALLATLLGTLLVIFTTSSISVIGIVYWSVAGLGVAYARMLAAAKAPRTARRAGLRPAPAAGASFPGNPPRGSRGADL